MGSWQVEQDMRLGTDMLSNKMNLPNSCMGSSLAAMAVPVMNRKVSKVAPRIAVQMLFFFMIAPHLFCDELGNENDAFFLVL